jgi:hypothetical protein
MNKKRFTTTHIINPPNVGLIIYKHVTCKRKPAAQSSTFYFARSSQNKKSLPFPNADTRS